MGFNGVFRDHQGIFFRDKIMEVHLPYSFPEFPLIPRPRKSHGAGHPTLAAGSLPLNRWAPVLKAEDGFEAAEAGEGLGPRDSGAPVRLLMRELLQRRSQARTAGGAWARYPKEADKNRSPAGAFLFIETQTRLEPKQVKSLQRPVRIGPGPSHHSPCHGFEGFAAEVET